MVFSSLALLVLFAAAIYGLFLLIFRAGHRLRGLLIFVGSPILWLAILIVEYPGTSSDEAARQAGFKDAAEMRAAEALDRKRVKFDVTLGDFANMNRTDRSKFMEEYASFLGIPAEDVKGFRRCIGDMAVKKSESLAFRSVFDWCVKERESAPEAFAEHFGELDAEDHTNTAVVMCRRFVEDRLRSPATADHPFLDWTSVNLGKWRYRISSFVDSQNGFGAVLRTHYTCEIQYDGIGDEYENSSWVLIDLSFS